MYSNYFSLLALEVSYSIDLEKLESNYIKLQNYYHPDLFTLESEKKIASDKIISINEAYKTLKSPLKRAEYLLKMYKVNLNNSDANKIAQDLMEIQESKNTTDLEQEIMKCIEKITLFFSQKDYYQAAKTTLLMNYLTKIAAK